MMREWVEDQLKMALLTDLKGVIPKDYFLQNNQITPLPSSLDSSGHLWRQLSWGHTAGILGKQLYYGQEVMSPRQLAAADVLMQLGHLVEMRAAQESLSRLKAQRDLRKIDDGGSGHLSRQFQKEHIPQLEENFKGGLTQYLKYLSKEEYLPYISLLDDAGLIELGLKECLKDKVIKIIRTIINKVILPVILPVSAAGLILYFGL